MAQRGKIELLESIRKTASMAEFVTVLQPEPLGLGHAVLCAKDVVGNEPFFVCLPDDLIDSKTPCVSQMYQSYEALNADAIIAVQQVAPDQINQYGILKSTSVQEKTHLISDLVEKPSLKEAPSNLGIVGRYLLPSEIFSILKKVKKGSGGEIQLTDGLKEIAKNSKMFGLEFEGVRYDTGDKLGYLKANLAYGLKREEFRSSLKEFIQSLSQ
ncbi:MAG: UTP--glucose-1-phosphate uridylyltransferase [Deltaproteobacteria bacterium]|nr:UTP--glucose-1-phosphate uridylyltransferase [Deltaproteobacteria bacterium]